MATPRGRVFAGIFGFSLSAVGVFYLMSDYQLIKYEEKKVEYDERGRPIRTPLKMRVQPLSPLELKPEAKLRMQQREEHLKQIEERQKRELELKEMAASQPEPPAKDEPSST
ncbi:Conserved hypothetical protein [Geotrichum candidum]|uniref:Uncharacterized protein n=1 Tax=Geotrichum candidum TaxID=1173061 RepID=A0A0J9XJD1_GEOCN|nr:Conserved hypothetical protein [Geotrichum candidum]